MASVNGVAAIATARQKSVEPARPTGVNSLTQTDFLRLLTTQLTNQDPTKPLDNNEFVAQMAQFSTVSGIDKMNAALEGVAAKLDNNRIATATSLIGKSVLVPGGVAVPDEQGGVSGAIDLPAAADDVLVRMLGPDGQVVKEMGLGPKGPGLVGFAWDGRAPDGAPVRADRFRVEAYTVAKGATKAAATSVFGRVQSVDVGASGAPLAVGVAGVGPVDLAQVRKIVG